MSYTKGPWKVGINTGFLNQVGIEPSIGCVYGAGDEVTSNAKLIAAAPDLVTALEFALPLVKAMRVPAVENMVKDALKKAGVDV